MTPSLILKSGRRLAHRAGRADFLVGSCPPTITRRAQVDWLACQLLQPPLHLAHVDRWERGRPPFAGQVPHALTRVGDGDTHASVCATG